MTKYSGGKLEECRSICEGCSDLSAAVDEADGNAVEAIGFPIDTDTYPKPTGSGTAACVCGVSVTVHNEVRSRVGDRLVRKPVTVFLHSEDRHVTGYYGFPEMTAIEISGDRQQKCKLQEI